MLARHLCRKPFVTTMSCFIFFLPDVYQSQIVPGHSSQKISGRYVLYIPLMSIVRASDPKSIGPITASLLVAKTWRSVAVPRSSPNPSSPNSPFYTSTSLFWPLEPYWGSQLYRKSTPNPCNFILLAQLQTYPSFLVNHCKNI